MRISLMHDAAKLHHQRGRQIKSPPNTAFSASVVKMFLLQQYFIMCFFSVGF